MQSDVTSPDFDFGRRLQLLIDAVIDYAIYMVSLDGRVITWNSGARRLKGYEAGEIIGKHFSTFFTPEEQAAQFPQKALQTAAREGKFEAEGWRVRKDGSRFWALAVLDAMRDEGGTLIGFVKITRDLTERREAHQRLLESERRYRLLVDAVVDYAIFQLDPEGVITTWNSGAERIKRLPAHAAIGSHFSRFYTEAERAAGAPAAALHTATAEGRYEAEGVRVRADGEPFNAFVVIDPIRDEDGTLLGFAKITRDITERVQTQQALLEAQTRLATAQKMEAIGQLSGGIAHDFNNLLMIVLGNLESAQRHLQSAVPNTAAVVRALGNAARGAQRGAALTSRLLAFSRRQALDPRPIDVGRFLASSADFLQRSLGERLDIHAVSTPGLWRIEADPNHLETALLNLAINARDAMPAGGSVTIEAVNVEISEAYSRANVDVTPGQYVMLSVTDTGEGMTADVLARAFEPFFTTKEIGQGTGLGLSQVYGFVKQSGGHIKIYSERGHGTAVKIYLPRYHGDARDNEVSLAAIPGGIHSETVLVVEDDDDLRQYICETLQQQGYTILPAPNAEHALALLRENKVDLVLSDVVMPGLNGREFAERAHRLYPTLPVIFMTGYPRNAVTRQGRLEAGLEFLQKPVSQAELADRVRAVLDKAGSGAR